MTPPASLTLADLAAKLGAELHGPADLLISGVNGIESASATDLSFVSNPRYAAQARTTAAGALLVTPAFPSLDRPTLRIADPYLAFARAIELFHQPPAYPPGIHPTAVVAPTASIPADAHLGAYVVIMDAVTLGPGAVLLPHVVLYPNVRAGANLFVHAHAVLRENIILGDNITIQNGAIIGADGFGFARRPNGGWHKIPQAGTVTLADGIEVQANSCVDRASVGETRIGPGTKIDNLVQIGHGSRVGSNTLLCAQVGLAGSTTVGNNVILAGQVGVAGHCTVGDGVIATAQSGIPGDVAPGLTVSGYPAIENRKWLKNVAATNRISDLLRNLKREPK